MNINRKIFISPTGGHGYGAGPGVYTCTKISKASIYLTFSEMISPV